MDPILLNSVAMAALVERRGCAVLDKYEILAEIGGPDRGAVRRTIIVRAADAGRWEAFHILQACTILHGGTVHDFAVPAGVDVAEHRLDESQIARYIAAAGVRPYWRGSRKSALKIVLSTDRENSPVPLSDNRAVRTALTALADVGLLTVTLGPKGGWTRARINWRPEAYRRLVPADRAALALLAA